MKMFLRPLSDAEILALYHPPQPPDEPDEPVVNPEERANEVSEAAERNQDPTINATKFLAGHPPKDSEEEVSSAVKDKVGNSMEVADDKIEADRESQTKQVDIELAPADKTDEAIAPAEKTQHEKEEITNQPEDDVLKKDTLPLPTNTETSSSTDSTSKEKPSDDVVEIVTEDSVSEGKPAEDGLEKVQKDAAVTEAEKISEECEAAEGVTSKTENPCDTIKTVVPEIDPVEDKEVLQEELTKETEEKCVDQKMGSLLKEENSLGNEKPEAFTSEGPKEPVVENVAEPTEEEVDRQKLVDIININITKFCRNVSYSGNETAQRKVRSVFNIINECHSAEDIYDKILCEGLQWFVEFHAEEEEVAKEEYSNEDDNLRFPPGRQLIPEKDSIVSKVLHEVNAPKIERKDKSREKSETEGSPQKGSSSDPVDFSITRNKASRQVKKYIRTGSGQQVDKTEDASKDNEEENLEERGVVDRQCPTVTFSLDDKDNATKKEEQAAAKTEKTQVIDVSQEGTTVTPRKDPESPQKTGLDVPGGQSVRFSPRTGGRKSLDVDREGGRELSIELAERRMKTHAVERSFSEALRDGKAKRKEQKRRTSGSQEDSIVTRLLREKALGKATNNTVSESETDPVVEKNESVEDKPENVSEMSQKDEKKDSHLEKGGEGVSTMESKGPPQKEGRVARERTESECSDTMPDLCPIEQEEEERRLEEMMEEMRKQEGVVNPEPEKKLRFSEEISKDLDVEKDRELTPIFLTNFDDDESEAEVSSADVTENLDGIDVATDVVEPQVRSVVENLFHEIFDQKSVNNSEQPKTEISADSIDSFIKNLVSRIIDLVLTLSRSELQSKKSTAVARGTFQMTGLETESEDESEISEMSEISECENVNDMFDLSMKRLNFIENSFKTMSSSTLDLRSITPDVQAITHSHDEAEKGDSESDMLEKIRQIIATEGNADEKLKRINNIVNGGANNCDSGKKGE